jgi:septal ring factor EnvC (AmiA/AmiB activator)
VMGGVRASAISPGKAPQGPSLFLRKKTCFLVFLLLPSLAFAHSRHFEAAQRALRAAQAEARLHHLESAAARRKAAADAMRAAVLAQQQVAAAASVRQLEDRTAQAAAALDALAAQGQAAQQALQQNEAALAALLPLMERLSRAPAATLLAVPASPQDAIRGIMVLQGIAAEIEKRAEAVHAQAVQVAALQLQAKAQAQALGTAVVAQQKAEDTLNAQIAAAHAAEAADLNMAAHAAAAEASATQNAEGLRGVIVKLQKKEEIAEAAQRVPPPLPPVPSGAAPPAGAPVAGTLVQLWGAATVAGPAVGIVYRAAPAARVVAPCSGPVLYANMFQNYGQLVILDCGRNFDFVLSGMAHLDVTAGQQVARGQPVGQMSGYDAAAPTRQPMLYVELRQNGKPVDPAIWQNGGGSG